MVPEFTDADKAVIAQYVSNRVAQGDSVGDINRDLAAHWASQDKAAAQAANAQATAQPAELPVYAPLPEMVPFVGPGGTAQESADEAVRFAGPLTNAEVARLLREGRSVRDIFAMIQQRGARR